MISHFTICEGCTVCELDCIIGVFKSVLKRQHIVVFDELSEGIILVSEVAVVGKTIPKLKFIVFDIICTLVPANSVDRLQIF